MLISFQVVTETHHATIAQEKARTPLYIHTINAINRTQYSSRTCELKNKIKYSLRVYLHSCFMIVVGTCIVLNWLIDTCIVCTSNLFFFFLVPFQMNQQCKVCGEPAAGFHFGAFTCEGCKVRPIFWFF